MRLSLAELRVGSKLFIAFGVVVSLAVAAAIAAIIVSSKVIISESLINQTLLPASRLADQIATRVVRVNLIHNALSDLAEPGRNFAVAELSPVQGRTLRTLEEIRDRLAQLRDLSSDSADRDRFTQVFYDFSVSVEKQFGRMGTLPPRRANRDKTIDDIAVAFTTARDRLLQIRTLKTGELISENTKSTNTTRELPVQTSAIKEVIALNELISRTDAIASKIVSLKIANTENAIQGIKAELALNLRTLVRHLAERRESNIAVVMSPALSLIVDALNDQGGVIQQASDLVSLRQEILETNRKNTERAADLSTIIGKITDQASQDVETATSAARQTVDGAKTIIIALTAIAVVVALLIVWLYVYKDIIFRLNHLIDTTRSLAAGNLDTIVPKLGNDELAEIGAALDQFKSTALQLRQREEAFRETNKILKNRDAEISLERQRFHDSLDSASNGIQVWGPDHKLIYSNKRFAEIRPDIVGLLDDDPTLEEFSRAAIRAVLPNATDEEVEARVVKPGQRVIADEIRLQDGRWIQRSISPTTEGGSVTILTDITALQETQELLEQQTSDLIRSNRELEQFAYLASHDLQEPLRSVASYCELLDRRYSDVLDQDGQEFLNFAVEGARRMRSLIDDLLLYSRVGRTEINEELIDLSDCLAGARQSLATLIEENKAVITADDLPTIRGNESMMTQVFQNLISNSIKFRRDETPEIHISVRKIEKLWEISFADNGIGIAPEFADRVFRIFQRLHTRAEFAGNGLGLALCQRIIGRHGGDIEVETKDAPGSIITLTLPAAR